MARLSLLVQSLAVFTLLRPTSALPQSDSGTSATDSNSLTTTSSASCIDSNDLIADLFDVSITPPGTVRISFQGEIDAESSSGSSSSNVTIDFEISLTATGVDPRTETETLDPCTSGFASLCPSVGGPLFFDTNVVLPESRALDDALFTAAGFEGSVRMLLRAVGDGDGDGSVVGCVEAVLTNGVGGDGSNATDTGADTEADADTDVSGADDNDTDATGTGGGEDGAESRASTAYLNWSLLVSAVAVLALGSGLPDL